MLLLGLLAGHTWLRTGDIALWLQDQGPPLVRFALDERAPRVVAAMVAGAALALAGTLVQATCRNPLAEPGILGITGGAGLGAVIVVTAAAGTVAPSQQRRDARRRPSSAALVAFALVYGLAWRGGLHADRLVLIGIGVWYGATALTTFLLRALQPVGHPAHLHLAVRAPPTAARFDQIVPGRRSCWPLALPLALAGRRELDLLALDDDTPRLVGVRLERVRLLVLARGRRAGRDQRGRRRRRRVRRPGRPARGARAGRRPARPGRCRWPMLLGAVLLGLADTLGRIVIAPAQMPAGLVVALHRRAVLRLPAGPLPRLT